MGITLGDAMTVIGIVAALSFSLWACILLAALVLPERSERSMRRVSEAPVRTFFVGLIGGVAWLSLAIVLNSIPNPLAKFAALVVVGALGCTAAIGLGGLARLISVQIHALDAGFSPFLALVRGSTILVFAAMMPLLGWFFLGPILAILGIGGGIHALFRHKPETVSVTSDGI